MIHDSFPAGELLKSWRLRFQTSVTFTAAEVSCSRRQKTTRAPQWISAIFPSDCSRVQATCRSPVNAGANLGGLWEEAGRDWSGSAHAAGRRTRVQPDPHASRSPHARALLHPSVGILLLLRISGYTHTSDSAAINPGFVMVFRSQ